MVGAILGSALAAYRTRAKVNASLDERFDRMGRQIRAAFRVARQGATMLAAFDTEGHLGNPGKAKKGQEPLGQPGLAAPPMVCASVALEDGRAALLTPEQAIWTLTDLIRHYVLTGASIVYDLGCACAAEPWLVDMVFEALEAGTVRDVLHRQALMDIAKGHAGYDPVNAIKIERYGLEHVARIQLGVELRKRHEFWRKRYALLQDLPFKLWDPRAREYPVEDVRNTLASHLKQEGGPNLTGPAEIHTMRAAWALQLSSIHGMRTDAERVAALRAEVNAKHEATIAKFTAVGIYRSNGTQDKKRTQALVSEAYEGEPPRAPKGGAKTDRDTLIESGDPLLIEFAESGENETLFRTFLRTVEQGTTVPICPSVDPLKVTARVSYYNPNLQNLPRGGKIRECFVARPGRVLCSVDYGTLELRTLAQVLVWLFGQNVSMAMTLRAGEDLHVKLAAGIAGKPYAEFLALVKAGDKSAKGLRQMSKVANFGLPGGLGAESFVEYARTSYKTNLCVAAGRAHLGPDGKPTCGLRRVKGHRRGNKPARMICAPCLEVSKEVCAAWKVQWPEMAEYFGEVKALVGEFGDGVIESMGTGFIRGGLGFTDCSNHSFQHLAAWGAKHAAWLVSKECYTNRESPLWNSRPCVMVHDEILTEIPFGPSRPERERAHRAAHRQAAIMRSAMAEFVPDIPIVAEPALMLRWYKDAEACVDSDGFLAPWERPALAA